MPTRSLARPALALLFLATACAASATVAADGLPNTDVLPVELNFTSVLARAPLQDTARVAGVQGGVVVVGLLNQTPPCFGLTAVAMKTDAQLVIRVSATEVDHSCATVAAGAFDYDVGVRNLGAGTYDVAVVHQTRFRDGRIAESKVGSRRVEVR